MDCLLGEEYPHRLTTCLLLHRLLSFSFRLIISFPQFSFSQTSRRAMARQGNAGTGVRRTLSSRTIRFVIIYLVTNNPRAEPRSPPATLFLTTPPNRTLQIVQTVWGLPLRSSFAIPTGVVRICTLSLSLSRSLIVRVLCRWFRAMKGQRARRTAGRTLRMPCSPPQQKTGDRWRTERRDPALLSRKQLVLYRREVDA